MDIPRDIETDEIHQSSETDVETVKVLSDFLGLDTNSEKFHGWKDKFPNTSEKDMLLGCLYNKITREQSRWGKKEGMPPEVMSEIDSFIHDTSDLAAEIIVNSKVGGNLKRIVEARSKLESVAVKSGVELVNSNIDTEPELNILSFRALIDDDRERQFLKDPLLIVGLTTHGDIPAYVVSKLLFKKGVVSSVALIRPTSRDNNSDVKVLDSDKIKIDEAKTYAKNVLVVDDSVEGGKSMEQALNFLNSELEQKKTVCVAVSLEVPILEKIEDETYGTIIHEGKTVYNRAAFFKPKL